MSPEIDVSNLMQLECQQCHFMNTRDLPYDLKLPDYCNRCSSPLRGGPPKFVPEALRKAAAIYEERNPLYGDNYKNFGHIMAALFPDGLLQKDGPVNNWNRLGVLVQVVSKLTRYCANFSKGGHDDSLDDMAVYVMMLKELDVEVCAEATRHNICMSVRCANKEPHELGSADCTEAP